MDAKIEALMELICDRCHYPYVEEDQEAMDATCEICPIEERIREFVKEAANGKAS